MMMMMRELVHKFRFKSPLILFKGSSDGKTIGMASMTMVNVQKFRLPFSRRRRR